MALPTTTNRSMSWWQRRTRVGRVGHLPRAHRAASPIAGQRLAPTPHWFCFPRGLGECDVAARLCQQLPHHRGGKDQILTRPKPRGTSKGLGTPQGLLSCARALAGATRSPCLCPAPALVELGARLASESMGFPPPLPYFAVTSQISSQEELPGQVAGRLPARKQALPPSPVFKKPLPRCPVLGLSVPFPFHGGGWGSDILERCSGHLPSPTRHHSRGQTLSVRRDSVLQTCWSLAHFGDESGAGFWQEQGGG